MTVAKHTFAHCTLNFRVCVQLLLKGAVTKKEFYEI